MRKIYSPRDWKTGDVVFRRGTDCFQIPHGTCGILTGVPYQETKQPVAAVCWQIEPQRSTYTTTRCDHLVYIPKEYFMWMPGDILKLANNANMHSPIGSQAMIIESARFYCEWDEVWIRIKWQDPDEVQGQDNGLYPPDIFEYVRPLQSQLIHNKKNRFQRLELCHLNEETQSA